MQPPLPRVAYVEAIINSKLVFRGLNGCDPRHIYLSPANAVEIVELYPDLTDLTEAGLSLCGLIVEIDETLTGRRYLIK